MKQRGGEWSPKVKVRELALLLGLTTAALTGAKITSAQETAMPEPVPADVQLEVNNAQEQLFHQLEAYLENREIGMALSFYDRDFNLTNAYGHREDEVFPIASSFKAFAVLYYYWYTPPEDWVTGPHTDIYNVAVYSHNRTTGEILHQVGERRRQADSSIQMNDIQMFNEFLTQTVGLQHGLAGWGFGSPVEGQTDSYHQPVPVTHHGRTDYVGNVTTPKDLHTGYQFLLTAPNRPEWNTDPVFRRAVEATWYQLGIFDANPQYYSPIDRAFSDRPHIGKDGLLTDSDLPNLGPIYTESSIIPLDSGYVIITYASEGESGAALNELSGMIRNFTDFEAETVFGTLEQSNRLKPGPETRQLLDAGNYYEHTGIPEIDRPGAVEVNFADFLNNPEFGAVVTVNVYDGTFTVYTIGPDRQPVVALTSMALVGERLPNSQGVAQDFNGSVYAQNGSYYDAEHGVLYQQFVEGGPLVPRHGFTPQQVGELHGFTATNGFGGLPVETRHAALWLLRQDGRSGLHSQFTFHEIPPIESHHYDGRRMTLGSAIDQFNTQGTLPHYRRTWSHGCVNLFSSEYTKVLAAVNPILASGQRVGVIFSYPGFDQNSLPEPVGYETEMDPLFAQNVGNWTDRLVSDGF